MEKYDASNVNHWQEIVKIEGWLIQREAVALQWVVKRLPPSARVVELGSAKGRGSVVIAAALPPKGVLYSVVCFGESQDDLKILTTTLEKFDVAKQIRMLVKDTVQATGDFTAGSLDMIFVDAGRDYQSVRTDIANWYPKLKTGGQLIVHDYDSCFPEIKQAIDSLDLEGCVISDSLWLHTKGKDYTRAFPPGPLSRVYGLDRGAPIDRYYIESFLKKHASLIRGTVVEVGDSSYTRWLGSSRVKQALVLHVSETSADITGDLGTGEGIPDSVADSFILTQTLLLIYDIHSAVKNALRILKPGGHLLVTVPGITKICRWEMDTWGQYWSFTDLSLRRLFEKVVPPENIKIETYGNVKAAACFLYGMAQHEMEKSDLEFNDPDYPVIIGAIIQRPAAAIEL